MKRVDQWDLEHNSLVIMTDKNRSSSSLMRVDRRAPNVIFFNLVKVLRETPRMFSNSQSEIYLIQEGDILDVRVHTSCTDI
jgi:hypothetical protein